MTRRTLNVDGTLTLKSFSYFGQGDASEAFRQEIADIEEQNRMALAEWNSLTPEEQEGRITQFEAREKTRREETAQRIAEAKQIAPHPVSATKKEAGPTRYELPDFL
jgi:hypothetical protein